MFQRYWVIIRPYI